MRPRSKENRFGLFVFGAIADHVHCHSARHVLIVVVVTTSSPFGQRIVGTHEDTKNDFNDDAFSTNNDKNKRGAQKGAPSRRLWSRWCRRSLKLDSLRLFISREECVIFMKGIECAVVRCPSLYLFDCRRRRRERRRRQGKKLVAALTALLRLSREEEEGRDVCGGLLLRV